MRQSWLSSGQRRERALLDLGQHTAAFGHRVKCGQKRAVAPELPDASLERERLGAARRLERLVLDVDRHRQLHPQEPERGHEEQQHAGEVAQARGGLGRHGVAIP